MHFSAGLACLALAVSTTWAQETAMPTPDETAMPTAIPTPDETMMPTAMPTAMPTPDETAMPTAIPTPMPTAIPTPDETAMPTPDETAMPTPDETMMPTAMPTAIPTPDETAIPTPDETAVPTPDQTAMPSEAPAPDATSMPTPIASPVPTPAVIDPVPDLCLPILTWAADPADGGLGGDPTQIPVCGDLVGACTRDESCLRYLLAVQANEGDDNFDPNCNLVSTPDACFNALNLTIGGEGYLRAIELGVCILCCNEEGFLPASFDFEFGGMNITTPAECTCREQNDEDNTPCQIPFFYDGAYHRDCIDVEDVFMCGTEVLVLNRSDLVECAPVEDGTFLDSCELLTFDRAPPPSPDTDDDSPDGNVEAAFGVAVSSLVFVLALALAAWQQ